MRRLFAPKDPEIDPSSIGNILVDMGLITKNELKDVVGEFRIAKDDLLGQFIVRKTTVTKDQVNLALLKQRIMRGENSDKVFDRLMEISKKSGERVSNEIDELTIVAQQAALVK